MKVTPLRRYVPKPVALLSAGWRTLTITTDAGERTVNGSRDITNALDGLAGFVCYSSGGLAGFRLTTPAQAWTLSAWRGRETRMTHNASGVTVTSLRSTLDGCAYPYEELTVALDWLRAYGVGPGSLSGMSWNLWRASLPGDVTIGFDPEVGRSALYGGRQEARECRVYPHMVSADIRSAYPHAMAQTTDYACSLREVSPSSRLDSSVAGLAYATVVVPRDLPYAPLPTRIAPAIIQFQWGTIRGVWPWCELAAAAAVGATVTVHRSWAPRRTADLFGSWWPMVDEGRNLGGGAGVLAKSISNSLWGQFGMVGDDRSETRWSDDKGDEPYSVDLDPRHMPHAWTAHVAAETTARLRTRMVLEALYGSQFSPVHMDTDGMIIRSSSEVPSPCGDLPGQWRIKERMAKVDIRAPQLYRYTCGKGCGVPGPLGHAKWHYVASGLSATQAPEFFRKSGAARTQISYLSNYDQCLTPAHSDDPELTTLDGQLAREHRLWKAGA